VRGTKCAFLKQKLRKKKSENRKVETGRKRKKIKDERSKQKEKVKRQPSEILVK